MTRSNPDKSGNILPRSSSSPELRVAAGGMAEAIRASHLDIAQRMLITDPSSVGEEDRSLLSPYGNTTYSNYSSTVADNSFHPKLYTDEVPPVYSTVRGMDITSEPVRTFAPSAYNAGETPRPDGYAQYVDQNSVNAYGNAPSVAPASYVPDTVEHKVDASVLQTIAARVANEAISGDLQRAGLN